MGISRDQHTVIARGPPRSSYPPTGGLDHLPSISSADFGENTPASLWSSELLSTLLKPDLSPPRSRTLKPTLFPKKVTLLEVGSSQMCLAEMKSHWSRATLIHCGPCLHKREMWTQRAHGRWLSGDRWIFRLRGKAGSDPTQRLERAQPYPTLIMDSYPLPPRLCGSVCESPCFSTPCRHTGCLFLMRTGTDMASSLPVLKALGGTVFSLAQIYSHPALVLWGSPSLLTWVAKSHGVIDELAGLQQDGDFLPW